MGVGYNISVDDLYFWLDVSGYNGLLIFNREGGCFVKSKICCDDIYIFSIVKVYVDFVVGVFNE